MIRLLLVTSGVAGAGWVLQAGGLRDQADVAALIAHVGERVAAYYQRAQKLVCVERSTVLPIDTGWGATGFSRTVESELRIETAAADGGSLPDVRVTRKVRRINGREPRERDRKDRSGCTDPTPLSPEPLAFLLPGRREEFSFKGAREGRMRDRSALIVDFVSAQRTTKPELIEDEYGHDECFDWKGPIAIAGRLWIDAANHDVLRLERRMLGPTDVRVPLPLQRRYLFPTWLTIERDDVTMSYREVAFSNPDEVMLLPESIESVTVVRTGLQSTRRRQTFSDYQRFMTDSRIIKGR